MLLREGRRAEVSNLLGYIALLCGIRHGAYLKFYVLFIHLAMDML